MHPCKPVRATRGALVTHRYTYVPPCCRTSQYCKTFIPLSVSLWNDLANPYSMMWNWWVSRAGPMVFYWEKLHNSYYILLYFSLSLLLVFRLVNCGAGVFGLMIIIIIYYLLPLQAKVHLVASLALIHTISAKPIHFHVR